MLWCFAFDLARPGVGLFGHGVVVLDHRLPVLGEGHGGTAGCGGDGVRGYFGDGFDRGAQYVGEDGSAIDVGEVAGGLDGVDAEFAPLDCPSDVACELIEENPLGAGVSVDERVHTGQISPVSGEILDERFVAVMVDVDAAVDVGEHSIEFAGNGRGQVVEYSEIAWRGVDGADVTGPVVEVAEQMSVDCLQVREVEVSVDRARCQLRHSCCGDEGFGLRERVRVGVSESVS